MNQADIEFTARCAAYERLLSYLLTEKLIRTNPEQWDSIKSAIIGPNVVVAKGVMDVSDLGQIETDIHNRIEAIFGMATAWAQKSLE